MVLDSVIAESLSKLFQLSQVFFLKFLLLFKTEVLEFCTLFKYLCSKSHKEQ